MAGRKVAEAEPVEGAGVLLVDVRAAFEFVRKGHRCVNLLHSEGRTIESSTYGTERNQQSYKIDLQLLLQQARSVQTAVEPRQVYDCRRGTDLVVLTA